MTVSFLLITFLYLLLFVAFLPLVVASAGNEQATEALRGGGRYIVGLLPGVLIPMVLSLGFQLVMNRLVFFQNSSGKGFKATGNTWLRFRFLCTPLPAPTDMAPGRVPCLTGARGARQTRRRRRVRAPSRTASRWPTARPVRRDGGSNPRQHTRTSRL